MAIRLFAAALVVELVAGSAWAAEPARAPTGKSPAPPGPPRVSATLLSEVASVGQPVAMAPVFLGANPAEVHDRGRPATVYDTRRHRPPHKEPP